MGDGFRGRSSTWSAGTTSAYGKSDLINSLNEECKLAYPFASLRSGQFQDDVLGLHSTNTLPPFSSSAPYPLCNGPGFPDAPSLNELCPAAASAHISGSSSPANSQVSLPGLLPILTVATTSSGGATNPAKRPARRNPWGAETYSDLIANAIESYPEKQATLQQIYDYISRNYIYFRERSDPPASAGWKVSFIISTKWLAFMALPYKRYYCLRFYPCAWSLVDAMALQMVMLRSPVSPNGKTWKFIMCPGKTLSTPHTFVTSPFPTVDRKIFICWTFASASRIK
ncbi:unnamed protein product [Schistocephalus solidus]|uniref:Fork-head domain-containing protein n=1 Tax=Schistocephalus solidus TaxID=70667 RepID=A0A183SK61_SCHSO|nr:unnamed protein product [Schistocephalus solidus]